MGILKWDGFGCIHAELEDLTPEELESNPEFERFKELTEDGNLIPLFRRVFSDHLTSVLAYRLTFLGS